MSYYHVCPDCGAALDPGERCDCRTGEEQARNHEKLKGENQYLSEYRGNKKTAADAANIDDGMVEKGLPTSFSISNDN